MRQAASRSRGFACALLGLASLAAGAQRLEVTPRVQVTETYSDNVFLLPEALARRGWITDLVPELAMRYASGTLVSTLDFRIHNLFYSAKPAPSNRQRFLDAGATYQAIENFLYFDGRANVSQLVRSPFSPVVGPDSANNSSQRVEARLFQAGPIVRGHVRDLADYGMRLTLADYRTDDPTFPNVRTTDFVGGLRSPKGGGGRLGWSTDVFSRTLHTSASQTLEDSRARASLAVAVDANLQVSAGAGYETTDFLTQRYNGPTYGVGLQWVPSTRTQLSVLYEKRFFGHGHAVDFLHRTPLTIWRFTSTADAKVLPSSLVGETPFSFAALMSDLLAPANADPAQRDRAVSRRVDESGVSSASPLGVTIVNAGPSLNRDSRASAALVGGNNTISLGLVYREQRALDATRTLSIPVQEYRQRGGDLDWSFRVTRLTSLVATGTVLRSDSLAGDGLRTQQRSLGLGLVTQLGSKTRATVGVRHLQFDSSLPLSSFRENAVYCTVSFKL